jgi:hypothetical protein
MIGARMFRIVTITPNAAKALNFDQKPNKTINYNGKRKHQIIIDTSSILFARVTNVI